MNPKYLYLMRFALAHPRIALLAWRLKRERRTYLGYQHLFSLAESCFAAQARREERLCVAEFGVGRGGSAVLLAWLVQRLGGTLTIYDVFGRIPPPSEKDGHRAQDRYRIILEQEASDYYGNLPNLVDQIRRDLAEVCDLQRIQIVQGRYEETLMTENGPVFDVVHIDCDWYDSVKTVLRYLESHLRPGAILQIDDYSNWRGSRLAVEEADWLGHYSRRLVGGPLVIDTGITSG